MHARLETRGADLVVIDLKSRNGTHVNDEAVVQTTLEPRDVLRFGDVAFRVERHVGPAWKRIGLIAGALIVLIAGALVLTQLSDWLGERGAIAGARKSMRQQAVENTRAGIAASRAGDAELTRAYLLHAADLLLLADLAPRGATLDQPREFFRDLLPALPEAEREFDFASALDPAAIASSEARLATLTNREYVEHQLRRYAVELNQDPNVPAGFVEQVWTYVDQYERFPAGMRTMLRRSRDLQPRIRSILASRHLPEAFCYVAWVESALDPMQMSGVGALGLWQIMPATARELGLQVVSGDLRGNIAARRQDQRTDIERSTAAAAEYVAKLLRDQGPEYFMLVLASYNRGPGAVDRAKQRVTDPMLSATRKFWYLSEHNLLPEETRNYVPRILAVRVIAESPERFGFEKP
jgi:soluble lytic murein transglycosylase-like protein